MVLTEKTYRFITLDDAEQTLALMVSDFLRDYPDPVPDYQYLDGNRGRGKLESALAQPQQSFGGQYLYDGLYEKAAALWSYLTLNHPFIDGNKRMGLVCCHVFLAFNGYDLIAPQDEAVEMSVAIASGRYGSDLAPVAEWLRHNSIRLEQIDPLMTSMDSNPQYRGLIIEAISELAGAD